MKIFIALILILLSQIPILTADIEFPLSEITETSNPRPKIGLALSGGGAKGLAHIGVLKVLESYNIPIDYITGTSIGSIIGGLYAIGYSADEIEELITQLDWDELLMDKQSRRHLAMEEKDIMARYAVTLPMKDYMPSLPKGLIAGQNFSALISDLTLSVHHIKDFSNLPTPFLCVATNIETGDAVVLDKGYLPDAIRASMSIPSMFTPIEIDGQLLVDGGLVENFPVAQCRKMGADIVIGVDVGSLYKDRSMLISLVSIMEQAVGFQNLKSVVDERKLCDILILPEVDLFRITDFRKADTLIVLGEKATQLKSTELEDLTTLLKDFPEVFRYLPVKDVDSVYVKKIKTVGLDKVSKNLIIGKLGLKDSRWIKSEEIRDAIQRLCGSNYFERVTYRLEPVPGGVNMIIRVVEKTTNFFQVGLNYNCELNAALLLNATLR
ncbi:MAG: patatin-like phospholipase family protein, partial [Candidatus Cloacimonetes bacterium]|nr:patatin-like phospholipase family protein [Candidatus Cloacimonadota bacterium]